MSVVTHKAGASPEVEPGAPTIPAPRTRPVARRVPASRPPTRRHVAGAPRLLTRQSCPPRRPRLAAGWLLAVFAATAIAVAGLGTLANSIEPSVPSSTTVVRVQPGENLWELAARVAPDSDQAAVVARIHELNDVDGAVRPGQPLMVPFEG